MEPRRLVQCAWKALYINGKPRPHCKNSTYPLTGRGRVHLRCPCGGNFYGYSDTSKQAKVVYECARNGHALGDERCPHLPRVTPAQALERAAWDQVAATLRDRET